jgi:hypothetical protein
MAMLRRFAVVKEDMPSSVDTPRDTYGSENVTVHFFNPAEELLSHPSEYRFYHTGLVAARTSVTYLVPVLALSLSKILSRMSRRTYDAYSFARVRHFRIRI